MRVVAERTTLVARITFLEMLDLPEARLRIALPRERPYGRKRDVGHLHGLDLADRAVLHELLQALYDRVVVHLKLDLADNSRLVAHCDHLVILLHVEGRNLHRQNVDALLRAPFHLLEVTVVGGRDHNSLNVGVLSVHLLGVEVAGNARLVELVNLLRLFVLGAGSDPVELLVVYKRLVVLAGMAVGHAHHCDLNWFHGLLA